MKKWKITTGDLLFWLGLLLCTVYQSYRYPLQMNSASTSPTYSDTPFIFQAGKFFLTVPILVIAILKSIKKAAPLKQWLLGFIVLFLVSFAVLKSFTDFNEWYIDSAYWMLLSLSLAWVVDEVSIASINKYFRFLFIFGLASTLIEVFCFFVFGRLPALAYADSFSVRFGAFLDDPNGFAAILFLLLGWFYAQFTGWKRTLNVSLVLIMLVITQSLTALGFLALVLLIWIIVGVIRRPGFLPLVAVGCVALFTLIEREIQQLPALFLLTVVNSKQESIQAHADIPVSEWLSKWADWTLFGNATYSPYEPWWVSSLVNLGIPYYLMYIGLITWLLVSMKNSLKHDSPSSRPIYQALLLFGCYFVLGSFNLSPPTNFPINVIFFSFFFLSILGKINSDEAPAAAPLA